MVVNQTLLAILLFCTITFNLSTKPATASCDRSCGDGSTHKHLPFPFGFSDECEIRLSCSSRNGEIKIGDFKVENMTSTTLLLNMPSICNRQIHSLSQLFNKNYALTNQTGFLLGNCSSPSGGQDCMISTDVVEARMLTHNCSRLDGRNLTCFSKLGNKNNHLLNLSNVSETGCGILFSSIAVVDEEGGGSAARMAVEVERVELGWWLQGNCTEGGCASNATCLEILSPFDGRPGFTCSCKYGILGDGFKRGDGCRNGYSISSTHHRQRYAAVRSNSWRKIVIGVVATVGVVGIIVFIGFFLRRKTEISIAVWGREKMKNKNVEAFLKDRGLLELNRYNYRDVKKMTDSFKHKIGQGGYGSVFKGKLIEGKMVAVKVLTETKGNGMEFINEVASISRTSHVNIVTLLGFCIEGKKRALIYEFMANGSLEKFIYNKLTLEPHFHFGWEMLSKIAIGIARGLEYLHRGCNTRILHFDIKPHNILLDEEFNPKIADFGLSKLCHVKESLISMTGGARGTPGYIAPELFSRNFGGVSHMVDVYSYGMMVLEMVGGRKNIDVEVANTSEIYFPHWIYNRLDLNEDLGLHGVTSVEDQETARKMILVGLWCIQIDPHNRPSMSNVLDMLGGSLEALQVPPKPFLVSPSREEGSSSHISTQ